VIAIIGATGALGSEVARRLLADGRRVAAVTRSPGKAAALASLGADVRVGDLTDRGSLDGALRNAEAVFSAAHSLLGRGRHVSQNVDDAGHRALIDAAVAQRVHHFVYTSVLGASPDHPVAFWRTKFAIEEYLKASGLSHTVLRPAAFMETHAYELLGKAVLKGRTAVILGGGDRPMNFV
jgi:NADH dehydrogenase